MAEELALAVDATLTPTVYLQKKLFKKDRLP